jgi:hypothetical protein
VAEETWAGLHALAWAAPNRVAISRSGELVVSDFRAGLHKRQRTDLAFDALVRLADRGPLSVAAFVRKYGPLNLHEKKGHPLGRLEHWNTSHAVAEPVGAYCAYARVLSAALSLVKRPLLWEQQVRGEPRRPLGVRPASALRDDAQPIYKLARGVEGTQFGSMLNWLFTQPSDGLHVTVCLVNWWFRAGDVRPGFELQWGRKGQPRAPVFGLTGGLWGGIGFELMRRIAQYAPNALCDFCGRLPIRPRLRAPKSGQRVCCGRVECVHARWRSYKKATSAGSLISVDGGRLPQS